jgi:hypothetical protein
MTSTIFAIKTSPAATWLAAIDSAFEGTPPRAPEAISRLLNVAPVIPLLSPGGYQYASVSLFIKRLGTDAPLQRVIQTCDKKGSLVERSDWNEHVIRFPWYFPEELIRLALEDDKPWSLWATGHQWVNSGYSKSLSTCRSNLLWAKGPAAAGGKWANWWETADCCTWRSSSSFEAELDKA